VATKPKEHTPIFKFAEALAKANKHPNPEAYAETVEALHDGKPDPHADKPADEAAPE